MSENVLKFRKPEKEQPPKPPRKPGVPDWMPWLGLVAIAVAIYLGQQAGWLGA